MVGSVSSVVPEEMVQLSVAVSRDELAQLQLASGVISVEAWARSVMLDLAGDLTKVEAAADSAPAEMRPTAGSEPLLVVGETALLLEQVRDLRDEVRRSLAEQQLWLQILYAEVEPKQPLRVLLRRSPPAPGLANSSRG